MKRKLLGGVLACMALVVATLALTCTAPQVRADTVLDQQYTATDGSLAGFTGIMPGFRRAETFTVGVAGTLSPSSLMLLVPLTSLA